MDKFDFNLKRELENLETIEASLTGCEFLIARTGSILVSSGSDRSRLTSVYPPVHIVVASKNQLVFDLEDAFKTVKTKYGKKPPSMFSVITGPSRTADIEKTLVMGAHGPRELFCFYVNENLE